MVLGAVSYADVIWLLALALDIARIAALIVGVLLFFAGCFVAAWFLQAYYRFARAERGHALSKPADNVIDFLSVRAGR